MEEELGHISETSQTIIACLCTLMPKLQQMEMRITLGGNVCGVSAEAQITHK